MSEVRLLLKRAKWLKIDSFCHFYRWTGQRNWRNSSGQWNQTIRVDIGLNVLTIDSGGSRILEKGGPNFPLAQTLFSPPFRLRNCRDSIRRMDIGRFYLSECSHIHTSYRITSHIETMIWASFLSNVLYSYDTICVWMLSYPYVI